MSWDLTFWEILGKTAVFCKFWRQYTPKSHFSALATSKQSKTHSWIFQPWWYCFRYWVWSHLFVFFFVLWIWSWFFGVTWLSLFRHPSAFVSIRPHLFRCWLIFSWYLGESQSHLPWVDLWTYERSWQTIWRRGISRSEQSRCCNGNGWSEQSEGSQWRLGKRCLGFWESPYLEGE